MTRAFAPGELRAALLVIAVLFAVGCQRDAASTNATPRTIVGPGGLEYTLWKEKADDNADRAQVVMHVVVPLIARGALENLLRNLHASASARPSKYHDTTAHVWVFAYASESDVNTSRWRAMIARTGANDTPLVLFRDPEDYKFAAPRKPAGAHEITYSVEGSAPYAAVTYQNAQGGTEQRTVAVPWSLDLSAARPGQFLYIAAQNKEAHGRLAVPIVVDGTEFKRSDSSGAYSIASASGTCC